MVQYYYMNIFAFMSSNFVLYNMQGCNNSIEKMAARGGEEWA